LDIRNNCIIGAFHDVVDGMTTEQKIDWLIEHGYKMDDLGNFYLIYRNGNYGARHRISIIEIIDMDINWIKDIHNRFISLAEKEYLF
jgi:hypothetical protein